MPESRFLDRTEAAQYLTDRGLRVSKNTLQKWVTVGGGPSYRRFGHRAVYQAADLDIWAQEKLTAPRRTAPPSAAQIKQEGVA